MYQGQVSELFKSEYSNLVAVLCQFYGIENIQLVEDLVSDAFVQAMKVWSHKGIPDNPKAWLRKVAINKYKDQFRRNKLFENSVKPQYQQFEDEIDKGVISEELIADSQLKMMFVLCHSDLNIESQLCLALRILCGFNIEEVASALLTNKETINKRLYRAKDKLKQYRDSWDQLLKSDYVERIDSVLRIIYLIFNEGYYSSNNDEGIREEMCWEAMRLALFISDQPFLTDNSCNALIALMCFHASRFESRLDSEGHYILYEDQDRSRWNTALIQKGNQYLAKASKSTQASKYHFEAAIAYWHTTDEEHKWENILQLYNKLLMIEYSPIIAMNRTYALARANSVTEAITQAKKLKLTDNHHYHCLLAELYRMNSNYELQLSALKTAYGLAKTDTEKQLINMKMKAILN